MLMLVKKKTNHPIWPWRLRFSSDLPWFTIQFDLKKWRFSCFSCDLPSNLTIKMAGLTPIQHLGHGGLSFEATPQATQESPGGLLLNQIMPKIQWKSHETTKKSPWNSHEIANHHQMFPLNSQNHLVPLRALSFRGPSWIAGLPRSAVKFTRLRRRWRSSGRGEGWEGWGVHP